ncbi:MAG: response regulator transcription factor [Bacteroidales bacterium]|jgi:DNA-binding NarL/FixJ family response regulator|nr:response regulator transcription factor [Bacteroidales bacterium]
MEPQIRVSIVDDHRMIVDSLEKLINEQGTVTVIDKAYSVKSARNMLKFELPDVLLLDVGLPDGDGCELCGELIKKYPDLKVIMLTTYAEIAVVTRAMESGAMGYVLKNATSEEILEGINTVADGQRFFCDEIKTIMRHSNDHIILTGREKELLKHIVAGLSNAEIADKMCLAEQTVKSYRKNLGFKLDVHNTAQLVRIALEKKLI